MSEFNKVERSLLCLVCGARPPYTKEKCRGLCPYASEQLACHSAASSSVENLSPQSIVEWASSWVPEANRARFADALKRELAVLTASSHEGARVVRDRAVQLVRERTVWNLSRGVREANFEEVAKQIEAIPLPVDAGREIIANAIKTLEKDGDEHGVARELRTLIGSSATRRSE